MNLEGTDPVPHAHPPVWRHRAAAMTGRALSELRGRYGLTPEAVGRFLDVPPSLVRAWEAQREAAVVPPLYSEQLTWLFAAWARSEQLDATHPYCAWAARAMKHPLEPVSLFGVLLGRAAYRRTIAHLRTLTEHFRGCPACAARLAREHADPPPPEPRTRWTWRDRLLHHRLRRAAVRVCPRREHAANAR